MGSRDSLTLNASHTGWKSDIGEFAFAVKQDLEGRKYNSQLKYV